MSPSVRGRSWWGWGYEDEHLGAQELDGLASLLVDRFGIAPPVATDPPDPGDLSPPPPRLDPPGPLADLLSAATPDRARHATGNAFRDVVRALTGRLDRWPDLVARPEGPADVARLLDWCAEVGAVCVPFGGGTSVVGGVESRDDPRPVVTLDLEEMDEILEVDPVSLAAHIQAGALGPRIEEQLRPHGLSLRHFPQSWEFSTLGGWIVTRAGGHYATGPTHIDDLVEAVTAETPVGTWSSRRLPGSGAGPSPDRLLIGSEGTLGVVTDAWVRVQRRPVQRAQASVQFASFLEGAGAVRALAQSGLQPANCRLLDPEEATLNGVGPGDRAVLVLGFESADHPQEAAIARALELCADHGGRCPEGPRIRSGDTTGDRAAESDGDNAAWRRSFLRAPYLRDGLVQLGMVVETFETAVTWDRFDGFVEELRRTVSAAAEEVLGTAAVTVRTTHAYPDGAAPYVTVIGPGAAGGRVGQWDEIKAAASEAILAGGGTITHHHAVGRDHVPWYERQRPDPFAAALVAAKRAVDPDLLLNPGVLGL